MISFFSVLPVKGRTHLNEFILYLFHLNLNIRAHKPGCSGACHRYEVSRPSLMMQNPTFPGFGPGILGPEDFPLKPEVRGTGSMTVICFVGNISDTLLVVSGQCFPLAAIAAAEVLQWLGFILDIEWSCLWCVHSWRISPPPSGNQGGTFVLKSRLCDSL